MYLTLRAEILGNAVTHGHERLREHELSDRFGVSRTPVREALKRLAAEGLVVLEPGRGLVIRRPTTDEIIDTYVVHEAVQGLAAKLCAERTSEVDVFRLETILNECVIALKDAEYERAMAYTGQFEKALRELTRNQKLVKVIEFLHTSLSPTSTSDSPQRMHQQLEEHRKIVEAIKKRDPAVAESVAREHSRRSRDHRLRTLVVGSSAAESGM